MPKKYSNLRVELDPTLHNQMRALAVEKRTTLRDLVPQLLLAGLAAVDCGEWDLDWLTPAN